MNWEFDLRFNNFKLYPYMLLANTSSLQIDLNSIMYVYSNSNLIFSLLFGRILSLYNLCNLFNQLHTANTKIFFLLLVKIRVLKFFHQISTTNIEPVN